MNKAKLIAVTYDKYPTHGVRAKHLHYEYRGHEYIITRMNNGYMESPMWYEHQKEQKSIDESIEQENKHKTYNNTAERCFDALNDFFNGNISEEELDEFFD